MAGKKRAAKGGKQAARKGAKKSAGKRKGGKKVKSASPTVQSDGIIGPKLVKSVSKWKWPFCQQFTELVHDRTLSLPTGRWCRRRRFSQSSTSTTGSCRTRQRTSTSMRTANSSA